MGTNTLNTASPSTVIPSADHNSLVTALKDDLVPRDTTTLAPTDVAGDLGSTSYRWDNAYIKKIFVGVAADLLTIEQSGNDLVVTNPKTGGDIILDANTQFQKKINGTLKETFSNTDYSRDVTSSHTLKIGGVTKSYVDTNGLDGQYLKALSVATGAIAASAVTDAKLGTGAVTTVKIDTAAVTADKLGTGAVTTAKLDTAAVTDVKLGTGAVTTAKIDSAAVTTVKIADGNVTNVKRGATNFFRSTNSGNFTGTSATDAAITNLTGSITISANHPVMVGFMRDPQQDVTSSTPSILNGANALVKIVREESGESDLDLGYIAISGDDMGPNGIMVIDNPGAGTYTYTAYYQTSSGTFTCKYISLYAIEL